MGRYVEDIVCIPPIHTRCKDRVTPDDFLAWASRDLKGSDQRARGNAVGNIKRAIHCRLDQIIGVTHVEFCADWNSRCGTETKLSVLKRLGLSYQALLRLITDIRNLYEHKYLVPKLKQVRAYYDSAELWLKDSQQKCRIGLVSLANIPIRGCGADFSRKGNVFTTLTFGGVEDVVFFWNPKKTIVQIDTRGKKQTEDMRSKPWKEMLKFEAPFIKRALASSSRCTVNQASATHAFKTYERWLMKGSA